MSTESDAGAGPAADADTGVGMWVTVRAHVTVACTSVTRTTARGFYIPRDVCFFRSRNRHVLRTHIPPPDSCYVTDLRTRPLRQECAGWDRSTRKHALRQLLQR